MEIHASPHTRSRAAQYVRMSTEHQPYSPENQGDIILKYAADHNMEIVQVYSDHGHSGLNIAGRDGLNQLMDDVENKRVNFEWQFAINGLDINLAKALYTGFKSSKGSKPPFAEVGAAGFILAGFGYHRR